METLTFAMGPVALGEDGEALRQRFAIRLTQTMHRPVKAVAAPSYAEVGALVADGHAELAWVSPAVFVRLERRVDARVLAAVERSGGTGYRGVLFVRAGSDLRELRDLAGTRAAWVDRDSCAGHLFPRLALREEGLDPDSLFAQERFFGSHGSVVHALMRDEADVGATYGQVDDHGALTIAGWYPHAGAAAMRVMAISAPIPADVICASRRVDAETLQSLRDALLVMHAGDGADLLDDLFGGRRLIPAHPDDYAPVRAALPA